MGKKSSNRDHGEFTLHHPGEGVLLVQLAERAQQNTVKPGQAWSRIQGSREQGGRTQKGIKVFHLDQATNRLTITEEWDGVETARVTLDMDALPEEPVATGPTAPPEAGSPAPTFFRWPFHAADLLPDDELRDWAMERAEEDIFNLSVLPRRIRLFGERFQEVMSLPHPLAPNVAPLTGATVNALARRRGVERTLVEGWFGSVDGQGTAWILEVGEDQQWWLAMRTFVRCPGMIGMWTSAWTQRAGTGSDTLTPSLRTVLVPEPGDRPIPVGEPGAPAPPEIGMSGGTLLPTEEVPSNARAVADRVGRSFEEKIYQGAVSDGQRVTVFRGAEWETWNLTGDFPMGLDDVIRAIAATGEPPTSLALVKMGVVPMNGEAYRALITEGEAGGRRYTRALLIRMAADGTVLGHQLVARDHGEIGDDAWIGVPPITEMSFFAINQGET